MIEKELTSEHMFGGKIIDVYKQTVLLANGKEATREVVTHKPAAVILPLLNEGRLLLVKQYRKAINQVLLEFPAGIAEDNEYICDTAKRELEEETGYKSMNMTALGSCFPAPGFCNEELFFFCAESLIKTETHFDEDECISLHSMTISECKDAINSGLIQDAKTIVGMYYLERYLCQK
jgi:ADP-ribose pyrophosphatase